MAGDPKYDNLPGIAAGDPDIYETSDLPEVDQNTYGNDDTTSDCVEVIPVNTAEFRNKFKGKYLNTTQTDFSEGVTKRRNIGYGVDLAEYESSGPGEREAETPVQKYQRLQCEIRQLVDEVAQIRSRVESDTTTGGSGGSGDTPLDAASGLTAEQLTGLAEALQAQTVAYNLEATLGPGAADRVDLTDPDGALHRKLLEQLELVTRVAATPGKKAAGKKDKSKAEISGGDDDKMVYEMFSRPAEAGSSRDPLARSTRLADLDARLHRLEATLGDNTTRLSNLCPEMANKPLLDMVQRILARSSLLEAGQLESLDGRLSNLSYRLSGLAERREMLADADTQARVAELYGLVKQWSAAAETLPGMVDRLHALRQLHEQALQFTQGLNYLETSQKQVTNKLTSYEEMLTNVEKSLQTAVESVKTNCENFDARLKATK